MGAGMVLVNGGRLATLNALAASWLPSCRIGLYQGSLDIGPTTSLLNVVPCTFSGYDGLHSLPGWSAAALLGNVAVSYSTPRLWQHDGGSVANWVGGYYVVDSSGTTLAWAQELPTPLFLVELGNSVEITPAYAVGSRY